LFSRSFPNSQLDPEGDIFSNISSRINQNLSTIIEQQKQGIEEQKILESEKQKELERFQAQQQMVLLWFMFASHL
jgi:hypothetical protein